MAENKATSKARKLAALIDDLKSGNEQKLTASLSALQSLGDVSVLVPIAEVLLSGVQGKSRGELLEFLSSLKDTSAVPEMIAILNDERFLPVRQELLGTIWNSPLDYSYYLAEFVGIATEGDYMEALECLTIIENMDGPFEERHVLEAQLYLRDYLESSEPKDQQKQMIMSEIAILIKDINEQDDDGIGLFNE